MSQNNKSCPIVPPGTRKGKYFVVGSSLRIKHVVYDSESPSARGVRRSHIPGILRSSTWVGLRALRAAESRSKGG